MKMEGLLVQHKVFGTGKVVKLEGTVLFVTFENKDLKFIYPDAFTSFIQAANPADQAAILQEIAVARAAVVAQQKAAEETKLAEIEKQMAEAAAKKAAPKSTSIPKKTTPKQKRITGKPMTFLVFQNSTFDKEYQGGYIWAPIFNKAGDTVHHWDRLLDVRPGDVILHSFNGYIQSVSIARTACFACVQPIELQTEDSWDKEGRRVDTDYIMLQHPIKTADHIDDIIRLCNTKYAPFNKYGTGNQGYLFEINREMAKLFLVACSDANPYLKGNQTIVELLAE